MTNCRHRVGRWALLFAVLFGGAIARADVDTASNGVHPDAVTSGGESVDFTSNALTGAVGEVAAPETISTSNVLNAGVMNLIAYPSSVQSLTALTASSDTMSLSWTAPGYDGDWGTLQPGTSYFIQFSTDAAGPWYLNAAQVNIGTSSVSSGDLQGAALTGLWPNTSYYAELWTRDAVGNTSGVSNQTVRMTFAQPANVLSNTFVAVYQTSATVAWAARPTTPSSSTSRGYILEASQHSDFGLLVLSSDTLSVAQSTLTVANLNSSTTYYFRVATRNDAGDLTYQTLGSTCTHLSIDTVGPVAVTDLSATPIAADTLLLSWTSPSDATDNPLNGKYAIQYATSTDAAWSVNNAQVLLSTTGVVPGQSQRTAVGGLNSNTTYYLRIWTSDLKPNWSPLSNGATVATLSVPLGNESIVGLSTQSFTVRWDALPAAPPSASATGYRLEASTSSLFDGTIVSSATLSLPSSTLTVSGLSPNTTYYLRSLSLNLAGAANASTVMTRSTLAVPPTRLSTDFSTATFTSVAARWAAMPVSPSSASAAGFRVEASSTNFDGTETVFSSATASPLVSTLTVSGLSAGTTYFFRVASLSGSGDANYTTLSATSTLALPVSGTVVAGVWQSSAAVAWSAGAAASAFRVEASSTGFAGGALLSSSTADGGATTLTVAGLLANTTYQARVVSLNANQAPAFAPAVTTVSLTVPPTILAPPFLSVATDTITARWLSLPTTPATATAEGYRLEASSDPLGVAIASATANVRVSTLAASGLSPNTTYYLRVGSLNWSGAPQYVALGSTSTAALPPASATSTFTLVDATFATLTWNANGNPSGTAYTVQLATAASFLGALASTTTAGVSATVTGLSPNTTYFARVAAVNNNGVLSAYLTLGSTVTLPSSPVVIGYPAVNRSSFTVSFTSGTPANPTGTVYTVQISSDPAFASITSSATVNLSATFTGLSLDTIYYARAQAGSGGTLSDLADFGSTATLAAVPATVSPTFSGVDADVLTVSWSSGSAATGYNVDDTLYEPELAMDAGFTTGLIDPTPTAGLSATFPGLVAGTTYFARVRAVNKNGVATAFVSYGSTATLSSAKPSFLAGTLEVLNGTGVYQDGTAFYTNITTPSVRVRVQSAFSPGLAVSDTRAHLALWHLDEGSGSTGGDASRHNFPLTLNGPAWIAGQLNGALDFDGSSNYAVSANLKPWRSSAATNEWAVSLWFRSTLGRGFLFQTASVNTLAGSTYDGEISWLDTSGNLSFEVNKNNTRTIISAPSSYADGAWHQAVAALNATGMFLYVDGQLQASGTGVTSSTARTYTTSVYAWVGAATTEGASMGGGTFQYYPGDIDELLISTVAPTASQVSQLYDLTKNAGIAQGAPNVDVSTQAGANFTWTRLSTAAIALTGTAGTTAAQTFVASMTLSGLSLVETASPGANTNRLAFIASSIDGKEATAYYTILVDTTPPTLPALTVTSISSAAISVAYGAATDALSGLAAAPYRVRMSTAANFSPEQNTGWISVTTATLASLPSNSTMTVRLELLDAAGNLSAETTTAVTLAGVPVAPALTKVYGSSVTAVWTAPAGGADGYWLEGSTDAAFGGTIFSSATAIGTLTTLTVTGLASNTTYYLRVGAVNHANVPAYAVIGSTLTLDIVPPDALTDFTASPGARGHTLDLRWSATGDDGSVGTLLLSTYTIQYTTDAAFSAWSPTGAAPSQVYRVLIATSGVLSGSAQGAELTGLLSGATYYLRAWTTDDSGNVSAISNGATAYATPAVVSVSLSTDTLDFGSLSPGATSLYATPITVANGGNVVLKFQLHLTDPAIWRSTTTGSGVDTFRLTGIFRGAAPALADFDPTNDVIVSTDATSSATVFARDADPDTEKGFNVAPGETRTLWLRIEMPPISSTVNPQTIRLTATGTE